MEQVVLLPVSLENFKAEISSIVRDEIQNQQIIELEAKLLAPAEVCKLFQPSISKVTLHKWTKDGRLQEHRIGGRVYYKYSEIMASLKTLKRYKKSEA